MPKFHFDLTLDGETITDEVGIGFDDVPSACFAAIREATEALRSVHKLHQRRVEVMVLDAERKNLMRIGLSLEITRFDDAAAT